MSDVVKKLAAFCKGRIAWAQREGLLMGMEGFPGPWMHEGRAVVCDGAVLFASAGATTTADGHIPEKVASALGMLDRTANPSSVAGGELRAWAGEPPRRWSNMGSPERINQHAGRIGKVFIDRRYLAILARDCADDDPVTVASVVGQKATCFSTPRWRAVVMHLFDDAPQYAAGAPVLRLERAA